ncbi:hypothetical protein [Brevundimonas aurantiaca]|nr:hypothetical protein [Brevundimonas aurantiaca]
MRHRSLLFAACAAVAFSGALMSAAPAWPRFRPPRFRRRPRRLTPSPIRT